MHQICTPFEFYFPFFSGTITSFLSSPYFAFFYFNVFVFYPFILICWIFIFPFLVKHRSKSDHCLEMIHIKLERAYFPSKSIIFGWEVTKQEIDTKSIFLVVQIFSSFKSKFMAKRANCKLSFGARRDWKMRCVCFSPSPWKYWMH